ncbi:MAG: hypothetical protein FJ030_01080 [Chloroflexi bacterium]|nr:hypothetical protein [Chloroflexota bacterium]
MKRFHAALIVFFASFMSLVQPGQCPYWLLAGTPHHPHHAGHPGKPISHNDLQGYYQADVPPDSQIAVIPVSEIIAALDARSLYRQISHDEPAAREWQAAVEPPPPR